MTLTAGYTPVSYSGDGSTTSFSVTFTFWDSDDLRVIHKDSSGTETVWTRGTQYTVTGGSGSTGTVEVETSPTDYTPASGETLTIKSNVPLSQTDSFPLGGAFPSTTVEQRFDKTVRQVQQQTEELDRALKLDETTTFSDLTVPDPVSQNILRWKSDLSGLENVPTSTAVTVTTELQDTDSDTKIQLEESPDEDIIRFDVAGSQVGVWDSTAFQVQGTDPSVTVLNSDSTVNYFIGINEADSNAFYISGGKNPDQGNTPIIRIDNTAGSVRVGNEDTLAGAASFMVHTDPNFAGGDSLVWFRHESSASQSESLIRHEHFSAAKATQPIFSGIANRGTISSPTAIQSGDNLLIIDGRGYDGSAVDHGEYAVGISDAQASIFLSATENWDSTSHGTRIAFYTTPNGSTTQAERIRIDDIGNVIIGHTTAGALSGGEVTLQNSKGYRFLNSAGTNSGNSGMSNDINDNLSIHSPSASSQILFRFANTIRGWFQEEHSGFGLVFSGESSADHSAPAANGCVLYTKDNGAGKTQLVVRFSTGAVQVIATEP